MRTEKQWLAWYWCISAGYKLQATIIWFEVKLIDLPISVKAYRFESAQQCKFVNWLDEMLISRKEIFLLSWINIIFRIYKNTVIIIKYTVISNFYPDFSSEIFTQFLFDTKDFFQYIKKGEGTGQGNSLRRMRKKTKPAEILKATPTWVRGNVQVVWWKVTQQTFWKYGYPIKTKSFFSLVLLANLTLKLRNPARNWYTIS